MSLETTVDQLKADIMNLTGSINASIKATTELQRQFLQMQTQSQFLIEQPEVLARPTSEADLQSQNRIPDPVKEIRLFNGDPTKYASWVKSVENVLEDYRVIKKKPLYRAIIRSIRQKITDEADTALIAYNIPDEDWTSIKKCLSLHYADKRDIRTLEYQLYSLYQGRKTIDEYFGEVNHQLTLIINKVQTECLSLETMANTIEGHRNRALDTFIRGLNGDLSRLISIKNPKSLPEAYSACLELQNMSYRATNFTRNNSTNPIVVPHNSLVPPVQNPRKFTYSQPMQNSQSRQHQLTQQQKNLLYSHVNRQQHNNYRPVLPPRQPRPEPMDVDRSIQTRQVNYMNRPRQFTQSSPQNNWNQNRWNTNHHQQQQQSQPQQYKRPIPNNDAPPGPPKQQRVFQTNLEANNEMEQYSEHLYEEFDDINELQGQELNFLMIGSAELPT